MVTQKPTLQGLIEQSRLLTSGQRQTLLKELPILTPEQAPRFTAILELEPAVTHQAFAAVIKKKSERDDVKFFAGLDQFFSAAASVLNKGEEPFQKTHEDQQLDHFFD